MKRMTGLVTCALLAVAFDASAKTTIRYSFQNPLTHPMGMAAQEFANEVKARTNGEVEIALFPGAQLGAPKELIQNLQMGVLDMTMAKPGVLGDLGAPRLNVLSMPYVFRDNAHQEKVLFGPIGDDILKELKPLGVVGLGYWTDSPRHFFFRDKEVTKVGDLKGLKIRSMTGQIFVDMMKAFGTSPTPMAFSELYLALQSGVVDGADQPLTGYFANRFNEVSKSIILDGHDASPTIILISQRSWSKLDPALQAKLREAHVVSARFFEKHEEAQNKKIVEELTSRGIKVIPVADKAPWQAAVQPLYEKYKPVFGDLIERINAVK